jgi:cbb3-type cytochrome oxidase maturation protein
MSVLYILIPAALILGLGFLAAFLWMLRRGQLDDLDTPPVRMLFDDEPGKTTSATDQSAGQCSGGKREDAGVSRRFGEEPNGNGGRADGPAPGPGPGPGP